MKNGSRVIIRHNPHHTHAENILGTVVKYRKGEGIRGIDLVDVQYVEPKTRETHTMPFGIHNLESAEPARLIALAERYEAMASEMRDLAESVDPIR